MERISLILHIPGLAAGLVQGWSHRAGIEEGREGGVLGFLILGGDLCPLPRPGAEVLGQNCARAFTQVQQAQLRKGGVKMWSCLWLCVPWSEGRGLGWELGAGSCSCWQRGGSDTRLSLPVLQEIQMLKSQKCGRWEAEGEREETLQKLQVKVAHLGHLSSQMHPHFSLEPQRGCQRAATPLDAGSSSLPVSLPSATLPCPSEM